MWVTRDRNRLSLGSGPSPITKYGSTLFTRFFHSLPPFCSLAFSSVSNRDRNARYENCRFLLPTRESNPRESLVGSEEKGNAKSNSVPGFFEASLDPFPPAASSRLVGSRENGEMRSWISPFSRASLSRFLKKK